MRSMFLVVLWTVACLLATACSTAPPPPVAHTEDHQFIDAAFEDLDQRVRNLESYHE